MAISSSTKTTSKITTFSSMAEVTCSRKKSVISTKPVQPGKFHHLSVLDRGMEHNHLCMVLYYHLRTGRKAGEFVDKLSESLSETLSAFPVSVGRLLRAPEGHWTVKCNDAGLRMVVAKAKGTVEEWLRNVDREKELKLILWEDMCSKPYFWSTVYVQITEFEGGGLAIGLSCAHIICDPISATMFIKAWADMNLGGKMMSPPFFHPLPPRRPGVTNADHQPYTHLINHYKSALESSSLVSTAKQTTITFLFSQEKVSSCIAKAGNFRDHGDQMLTPFEALAALFWTRISKVKGMESSLVNMSICLNVRKLLGLDKGYFGNCLVYNRVEGYGLHGNDDLSKAASSINQVVKETDYDGVLDLIEWLEGQEKCENPPWMNDNHLICANFEDMETYSVVFEDSASPLRVSYYIEPAVEPGQVLILPSPRGEGALSRVVMVTLPEDEAEKLLVDDFIKQFGPTILMGLSKKHY